MVRKALILVFAAALGAGSSVAIGACGDEERNGEVEFEGGTTGGATTGGATTGGAPTGPGTVGTGTTP